MKQTKEILISVAGADGQEYKPALLLPGTKVFDVLTGLKLEGFALSKPQGGLFRPNDDLYAAVTGGEKLYAAQADVQAG